MQTQWNYSELAKPYLNRPDYSYEALEKLFSEIKAKSGMKVCDIGAGVAHLTIPLLEKGFVVDAVEPNNEMRALGKQRTSKVKNSAWFEGTGENTGMRDQQYDIATFGSSFNVTDRSKALIETHRILKDAGWFVCMWNHRNLDNELQASVEAIIKKQIQNYDYGTRRQDQTKVINDSGLFSEVKYTEGSVTHEVTKYDWVEAWKSHATLARQAGDSFYKIIDEIEQFLSGYDSNKTIIIPYTTKIWFAQKK